MLISLYASIALVESNFLIDEIINIFRFHYYIIFIFTIFLASSWWQINSLKHNYNFQIRYKYKKMRYYH